MGHPAEGEIRAFLDGEATGYPAELRAHLESCSRCEATVQVQSRALATVGEALSLLDVEPAVDRARARILRRKDEVRGTAARLRQTLPRAASFVILFTAGAAAALPGSPVRRWISRGWEAISAPEESAIAPGQGTEETGGPAGPLASPGLVGATIPPGPEGLELHLRDLAATSSLRILFVDGDQAGIFAGEGTRFRSEAGRLVASNLPGDVRVEVPRGAPRVLVVVNGETYLRKAEGELEVLGPVRARTPTEIRFGPSSPEPNGISSGG